LGRSHEARIISLAAVRAIELRRRLNRGTHAYQIQNC
jgi:hypothetical protein